MSDSDSSDKRNKWLIDPVTPDLVQQHKVKKVIFSGKTAYQKVEIVDLYNYGLCLVLDGKIQSGEHDEHVYHEALVQPAMLAHPKPTDVFIAGGGEGATLREVLKHRAVEKVVMVDLDQQVVELCRRYLTKYHRGAYEDPRLKLVFSDARKYLEENPQSYDVIIIDVVDPLESGPACLIYTREHFEIIKNRLKPGGIMVVQSGSCGWTNLHVFTSIVSTLKAVFPKVRPYNVYVPSFVDMWGFTTASAELDPARITGRQFQRLCREKLTSLPRSLDSITYPALFILSKRLRQKLSRNKRIVTDAQPVFI